MEVLSGRLQLICLSLARMGPGMHHPFDPQVIHAINSEYRRVHSDLEAEGDRSAAVLGAAYLEDLLDRVIDRHSDDVSKPARDFYAKIDAARQRRLVPELIADDLQIVRQIRNRFAHEWRARTLADAEAQELLTRLHLRKAVAQEDLEGYPDIERRLHRQAIASLRAELSYILSQEQPLPPPVPGSAVYQLVIEGRKAAPTFGVAKASY